MIKKMDCGLKSKNNMRLRESISHIYHGICGMLSPIVWAVKNQKYHSFIYNRRLPMSYSPEKYVMIRDKSEVYGDFELGRGSYISGPYAYVDGAKIGKYCSIARFTTIGVQGHNYNWVTTSPLITSPKYGAVAEAKHVPQKDDVIIGNDVWIGMYAIINRGVKIGDGAVVGGVVLLLTTYLLTLL